MLGSPVSANAGGTPPSGPLGTGERGPSPLVDSSSSSSQDAPPG